MIKVYKVKVEGKVYEVEVELLSHNDSLESNSKVIPSPKVPQSDMPIELVSSSVDSSQGEAVYAPMQGNIWKILKQLGDEVKAGEPILILEAMKMENDIVAPKDGKISYYAVKEGDAVDSGSLLLKIS